MMTVKPNGDRRDLRVVIVGGSLVGLCTAVTLARRGARVTVLERTPEGRYQGGGGLGVDVTLLAAVTGLAERPLETHARRTAEIALRRGAEVVDAGDGWAQTVDGERYEADAVIGADGARSTVRRRVTPERSDGTYAGYLLWRAMVPESDLPDEILPAPDEPSREHYSGPYRLVTYLVPGADGSTTRGQRRLNLVWYDPARSDLLEPTDCSMARRSMDRSPPVTCRSGYARSCESSRRKIGRRRGVRR